MKEVSDLPLTYIKR